MDKGRDIYEFIYCEGEQVGSRVIPKRDDFEFGVLRLDPNNTQDAKAEIESTLKLLEGWSHVCVRDVRKVGFEPQVS